MKKTILVAKYDSKKMHIYDVETKGKHPVHLIDGGCFLTEDDSDFGKGDMYWFWLNSKEYAYYRSQLKSMEFEVDDTGKVTHP